MTARRHLVALAILAAAVAIASRNSYGNAFLSDDSRLIVHNSWLDSGSALDAFRRDYYAVPEDAVRLGYYRPLTLLWNRLDFALWGRAPGGWHLGNWLAHLSVALLLYTLATRLHGSFAAALLAALAFATSPLRAESVTFVSGRVDVLATLFGLAMVLAATAGRPLLAALLWLPALLAKEVAVVFAPLAALTLLVSGSGDRRERLSPLARLVLAATAVFALYLLLRLWGTGVLAPRAEPGPALATLARVLNVHAFYWWKLLAPGASFDVEPPLPGGETLSVARAALALFPPLLGLVVLARGSDPRSRSAGLGLLWVSVALLPVSQIVRLETAVSPRYTYVAAVGFALAVGAALDLAGRWGRALGAALILGQIALLSHHNGYYRDPVTFYQARKTIDPDNQANQLSLAGSLLAAGRAAEAAEELEAVARRWPDNAQVRYQAGTLALELGHIEPALAHLERAARDLSLVTGVHLALGRAWLQADQPERAASAFRRALLADPGRAEAALGRALATVAAAERGGDPCVALAALAGARQLAPQDPGLGQLEPARPGLEARCASLSDRPR